VPRLFTFHSYSASKCLYSKYGPKNAETSHFLPLFHC
jgi:hypothetical protein